MEYYLVGIKGTGMSSLACMLYDLGYSVRGCDVLEDFDFLEELKKRNIQIDEINKTDIIEKIGDVIYIISSAYEDTLILEKIREHDYSYFYYQEYLSMIPAIQIAVAGTHGKTTTTKMIADILKDESISYVVGSGEGLGKKNFRYFLYEACEYKRHFLNYHPDYLVITNIEYDHPDYYKSIDDVRDAFETLKKQSKVVINKNEYKYKILKTSDKGFLIRIYQHNRKPQHYFLPFCGKHMIENFMDAYRVIKRLGFTDSYIKKRIKNITLPKRRSEEVVYKKTIIIKDYAHHPSEIKALHDTIKQKYPSLKTTAFFEPHTYSRTLALIDDFKESLSLFDKVYINDVFTSAREIKNNNLQKTIDERLKDFEKFTEKIAETYNYDEEGIVVFLGAGTIIKYSPLLKK